MVGKHFCVHKIVYNEKKKIKVTETGARLRSGRGMVLHHLLFGRLSVDDCLSHHIFCLQSPDSDVRLQMVIT